MKYFFFLLAVAFWALPVRVVSAEAARNVYGIVLSGADVDTAATADRRKALIEDRISQEAAE